MLEATYRILDASANRAAEGLRTLEEYARFARDDAGVSADFKSLRHDLAAALSRLSRPRLLAARDSAADVGTGLGEPAEYTRAGTGDVLTAAAARVQQSLRCLEEYGKTIDVVFAQAVETLRYRAYDACARIELQYLADSRRRPLLAARLYLLIDAADSEGAFVERMRTLAAAGVDVFQLRDRSRDDRTLYERARIGAAVARELGVLWIINDRADIAAAVDADGVHVGQDELPAAAARSIIGSERLLGISTHSIDQARQAVADGADYLGCGPVFPGHTKQFDHYVGSEYLRQVAAEISVPSFAIGGIDLENVAQVVEAGFHRIAVTAAVAKAGDPPAAARALKSILMAATAADEAADRSPT